MNKPTDVPFQMPFSDHLGIKIIQTEPDQVIGALTVEPQLCTTGKRMHGGALMAFADTLGAIAAYLNLPDGAQATTTIESKTNFVGAAKLGEQVRGETTALHVGRRTSVWQTKITTSENKTVAIITQTQLVL